MLRAKAILKLFECKLSELQSLISEVPLCKRRKVAVSSIQPDMAVEKLELEAVQQLHTKYKALQQQTGGIIVGMGIGVRVRSERPGRA